MFTHAYMKKSKKVIMYVSLCIDDNLLIGNPDAIDENLETG